MSDSDDEIAMGEEVIEAQHAAAKRIQAVWRGFNVRKNVAPKAYLQLAWNLLDTDDERHGFEADAQFETLTSEVQPFVKQREIPLDEDEKKKLERKGKKVDTVPLVYFNVEVPDKINLNFIENLIIQFKLGHVLEQSCVEIILARFEKLLEAEVTHALVDLTIPDDGSLCVIGDTHGQLVDLLTIFRLNGMPSEKNVYLFNGDYVDRGLRGMEICMILFSFKLWNSQCINLNRGNHECQRLNEKYSFEQEVLLKYDSSIFVSMQKVFCLLPLAHVVDKKVFVCHGGLVRDNGVTLDTLRSIDHRKQIPKKSDDPRDQYFEDLLWSDPCPTAGRDKNSRGAGIMWGADVTADFLRTNNLQLIIRSHELVPKGYAPTHDHQVITLFSASNYCGTNDNYGAFVRFNKPAEGEPLVPNFTRFHADPVEGIGGKFSFENLSQATTQILRERIFHYRPELTREFTKQARLNRDIDIKHKKVTKMQWVRIMSEATGVTPQMPWHWLQPYLAKASHKKGPNGETLIPYKRFLKRYRVKLGSDLVERWEDMLMKEVCEALYQMNAELDAKERARKERKRKREEAREQRRAERAERRRNSIARGETPEEEKEEEPEVDENAGAERAFEAIAKGGSVSKAEFIEAMKGMSVQLTGSHLALVASNLDKDKDDEITYKEFMTKFRVLYHDVETENKEKERWMNEALKDLGAKITKSKEADLAGVFAEFDADKSGSLSYDEFGNVLKKLLGRKRFDSQQREEIAKYVDKNRNGLIEWKEFMGAIQVDKSWQDEAIQSICNVLFRNRYGLKKAFQTFDLDGSGDIDVDEFVMVIGALNKLLDAPLSTRQVKKLHKALDTNGDGTIDYDEFVSAFKVIDTMPSLFDSRGNKRPTSSSSSSSSSSSAKSSSASEAESSGDSASDSSEADSDNDKQEKKEKHHHHHHHHREKKERQKE